jgi:hypothetical protein
VPHGGPPSTTQQLPPRNRHVFRIGARPFAFHEHRAVGRDVVGVVEVARERELLYRTPGKGRVFYTNFARLADDLASETLGDHHLWLGLGWVLGR